MRRVNLSGYWTAAKREQGEEEAAKPIEDYSHLAA